MIIIIMIIITNIMEIMIVTMDDFLFPFLRSGLAQAEPLHQLRGQEPGVVSREVPQHQGLRQSSYMGVSIRGPYLGVSIKGTPGFWSPSMGLEPGQGERIRRPIGELLKNSRPCKGAPAALGKLTSIGKAGFATQKLGILYSASRDMVL